MEINRGEAQKFPLSPPPRYDSRTKKKPPDLGLSTLVTKWVIQINETVFCFQNQGIGKLANGQAPLTVATFSSFLTVTGPSRDHHEYLVIIYNPL